MRRSARWPAAVLCLAIGAAAGTFVAGPLLHGQAPAEKVFPRELTSYSGVVKKVMPAVVSIESRARARKIKSNQPLPKKKFEMDPRVPEEFRKFFEDFQQHQFEMPEAPPHMGFGSGFIVDPTGVVMTNYHVVAGADQVVVHLADGRKFTSKEIRQDPKTDLAIIQLETKEKLPALELGDSDVMEIGDRVLAVGAPFGLRGSVTHGIISAKGRNGLHMNMYEDFLQTDAPINPGNSGGPLVNLEGKVIGINAAIKSRNGGFQGVGLAVSSNLARNVMAQLQKHGVVKRGYLGVQIRDLDPEVAERLGLKDHNGVVVSQVFEDTPAGKAGIKAGDVITSVAGHEIKDGIALQRVVARLELNKPADIVVLRDGKKQTLKVTVAEQPQEFGTARVPVPLAPQRDQAEMSLTKVGAEITDLTPELAEQLGFKDTAKGAVITSVERGGLADVAGLRRGTLVVKVDNQPVATAEELQKVVEKGSLSKGLLFQVQTPQGGVSYVLLREENTK